MEVKQSENIPILWSIRTIHNEVRSFLIASNADLEVRLTKMFGQLMGREGAMVKDFLSVPVSEIDLGAFSGKMEDMTAFKVWIADLNLFHGIL